MNELITAPAQDQRKPADVGVAIAAFAAYALLSLLLPFVRISLIHLTRLDVAVMVIVPTVAFMFLQIWLAYSIVRLRPGIYACIILMMLSICGWLVVAMLRPHHRISHEEAAAFGLLLGFGITLGCTFFGIALSRIVREPNVLLPVALVAMPIDFIGAMTPVGFTHNVVASHPHFVQAVSVPVPTIAGVGPIAFIGPGDALFIAFFFAVVLRLRLNERGTFWWMFGLLTLSMLIVLFFGPPIGALVPMGIAVLIANGRMMRLKRAEVFATLYALALVLVIVVAFYTYTHSHFFAHAARA